VTDDRPGKELWATKRSLSMVLKNQKCKEFGIDEHNVLMIDSEIDKVRDYPNNSIVIKDYALDEVMHPTEDQSKILSQVKDYVFKLVEEADDVRTYL